MDHNEFMAQCFSLALRGRGFTAPNPMVGAVLVYKGVVIGMGWHHKYGARHAEIDCLENVDEAERHLVPESTLYVNLEPCAHHGKTPPCAERLVQEKVKEVVIANTDPFEQVNGRGIELLKQGGIAVTTGILEKEASWLNRRFFCFHTLKRPYIILKWAQTADGIFAPADRSRHQITGGYSQLLVHKWRTEEAAVMVGGTTAMNDNPQLTARLIQGRQPLRIVLDRRLQLPHTHDVFDKAATTWIVNEQRDGQQGNVHYFRAAFDRTLLPVLMQRLYESQFLSLIVEGGAALLDSFLEQGLWDEARVFTGSQKLVTGIPAPVLTEANLAFNTFVEQDTLGIFVNKNSPFTYMQGMEI